jgi:hypothetical protein
MKINDRYIYMLINIWVQFPVTLYPIDKEGSIPGDKAVRA